MACEKCGVLRCQILKLEGDLKKQKELNEAMSDALHKMENECQCKLGEALLKERRISGNEAGLMQGE